MMPQQFIPFAESVGLVGTIDEWVARGLSAQHRRWHEQGLDPYVGINVSPLAAARSGAVEKLIGWLSAGGLDLDHVTVEPTESEALRDDPRLARFAAGLDEAG